MKLSLVFLATGALAATLDPRKPILSGRQDGELVNDIEAINTAVKAADSSLNSGDYDKLADDFNTILDSLDKATTAANKSPQLEQEQALALAQPAQDLSKQTVKTLQDVSSKKSDIVKANKGGAVYTGLQQAQEKAGDFIKALTSKIPPSLSTVAAGIVQPAVEQLKKTVNDFKDAGGSGGSSEATSPSSSVAAPAAPIPELDDTASAPTEEKPAESSAPSTPAVYGPPPSTNASSTTPSTTPSTNTTSGTPTSAATPESYTGAAATVFAMGPAALAAAAIAAVAAL